MKNKFLMFHSKSVGNATERIVTHAFYLLRLKSAHPFGLSQFCLRRPSGASLRTENPSTELPLRQLSPQFDAQHDQRYPHLKRISGDHPDRNQSTWAGCGTSVSATSTNSTIAVMAGARSVMTPAQMPSTPSSTSDQQ
jgi:hypothetical protein